MIKHIKCDIFESGADVILHQVNCQGVMGSGIAKQVKEKYPEVYKSYVALCHQYDPPLSRSELLGLVQMVRTESCIICNLFAQDMYGYDGKCYTNYDALKECFTAVSLNLQANNIKTVAIPYKIGCARGGGDWNVVYQMIEEIFDEDYNVLICEYDRG